MLMFISKRFEDTEFQNISDMLMVSLVIFGAIILIDLAFSVNGLGYLTTAFEGFNLALLTTGMHLVLIPLIAVLFLGAASSLRE